MKSPAPKPVLSPERRHAFTLLELLVVIAVIAILAGILLPTLARSRERALGLFCLQNTRQLTVGWILYSDDHDGRLPYNLGVGAPANANGDGGSSGPDMSLNWANNVLDWQAGNSDNTNTAKLVETGLGPYLNKATAVFRCPSDHALSSDQLGAGWTARVRSYSMNGMVGDAGTFSGEGYNENNPKYAQYFKMSQIKQPSNIFVFLDEHPDTIRDGYFINRTADLQWRHLPASYHNGAAALSFADGHSETHRWKYASTRPPSHPFAIANLPFDIPHGEYGDFYWILYHMSSEEYSPPATGPAPNDSW
jgi:prepilin-type N-terminal cleavage/methylation domain-containing protein/prepilin-type processing-associated H-X9-DG protein